VIVTPLTTIALWIDFGTKTKAYKLMYVSTLSIMNMSRFMGFVSTFPIACLHCGSFCKTTFHPFSLGYFEKKHLLYMNLGKQMMRLK